MEMGRQWLWVVAMVGAGLVAADDPVAASEAPGLHVPPGFVVRRTAAVPVNSDTEIYLLDTLGELPPFYAAGDVAFVGGSLGIDHVGGHNLLEPAALSLPIVAGPHNFNSADIARMLQPEDVACAIAYAVTAPPRVCGPPTRRPSARSTGRSPGPSPRGCGPGSVTPTWPRTWPRTRSWSSCVTAAG